MKHLLKLGSLLAVFLIVSACTEVEKGQYAIDTVAPGTISNYNVTNKEGKSVISYDLPADEDLLYVKATYKLNNGKDMEVKASAYVNELEVLGFGKAAEHDIKVTTVDRSGNESEPVIVKVTPLDNPIYKIFDEMQVASDFGGLSLKWKNETEEEITISVSTPNEYGEMVSAQNFYTKAVEGVGFVRGYSTETSETEGRRFAITITDHWGNQTDVKDETFYPIYEIQIPSDRFSKYVVPGYGDPGVYNSSKTPYEKLWNNSWGTNDDHYHSKVGQKWPFNFGMNLGRLVKLSRFKYYQRTGGSSWKYLFAHGNPKRFKVYGVPATSGGVILDITDPNNGWILLTEFTSTKPSGLPLQQTNSDDQAVGNNGEDVLIPIEAPAVQWIRIEVEETWGGVKDFIHMAELTFYGSLAEN